ncbi:MAG: hypothetical protein H0T76_19160 [Nannocystis sp.]|nr:hypothetical protein [Nannocystis sp.]MBA3548609.1 hypothetical protein [Nannocystis sp.]
MRRIPLLALGLLLACSPPGAGNSASATTGPALTSTGDGPTGGSTGDACLGSGDCETEAICVADYEAADMPPGGKRGPASCQAPVDCVGATDLGRWCFDHQGCCDDLRCRPADGICEPPTLGQTTGAATTGTTGTTGEPGTGTTEDTGATSTGETTGTTGAGTTGTTGTSSSGTTA